MKINTNFDLGQLVEIQELKKEGVVLSIWIVDRGVKYEVRYFDGGDPKDVYFYERELRQPAGKKKYVGFHS